MRQKPAGVVVKIAVWRCFLQVFGHPALQKAKVTVGKNGLFQRREKMFISR